MLIDLEQVNIVEIMIYIGVIWAKFIRYFIERYEANGLFLVLREFIPVRKILGSK